MPTTSDGLPFPLDSQAANLIGTYIQNLAQAVDDLWVADLYANRPTYGKAGRRFYATDTGDLWNDTGTAWVHVSASAVGAATGTTGVFSGNYASVGTLTQSVSGVFVASSNRITVMQSGLYCVTAVFAGSMNYQQIHVNSTCRHSWTEPNPGTYYTGSLTVRLAANDRIQFMGVTNSGQYDLSSVIVDRLSP